MKVLVTGGAGFIGSHLVDRLIEEGHEVFVVDNLSTGKKQHLNHQAVLYKLDVQSSRLEKVFRMERPNVVFHMAAQINERRSTEDPMLDAQVNILGTMNVLHQAAHHGVRKVIFASSGGAIYGEQDIHPAPESHPPKPLSAYGISKFCGEQYLAYYQRVSGLQVVGLRYAYVYGPRQSMEGEGGMIASFIQQMLNNEQPIINGNGRQTRDFIFVDDVVQANLVAMGQAVQGIYNVSTGVETSINELFRLLTGLTGASCKEVHGPAKPGEPMRSVMDSSRFKQDVGWEPEVSLMEGLEKTVAYFRGR
ncbi:MAG: NAD-dependent epimerase/dehydratase family protein [Nitrospira sp.]|nr:NAD-dependent epimerase/dehydratase family protein [Nitrospira sp.]